MKRALVALTLLALAGCGTATPGAAPPSAPPSAPPPSAAPSASKAAPESAAPTFADLTQGSAKSVVKMYSFDADEQSAVVEPITFDTAVCADGGDECREEWDTQDSHSKVTVPVADAPKFFNWQNDNGDVCLKKPEDGGTCKMTEAAFARAIKEEPGAMVAITTDNGEIVRAALIYIP